MGLRVYELPLEAIRRMARGIEFQGELWHPFGDEPAPPALADHSFSLRSDINWVIMDYLVSEGYPGAAEKFAQETNLCQPADIEGIRERVRIRSAIHSGRINDAIDMVNGIDSEVSESKSTFS